MVGEKILIIDSDPRAVEMAVIKLSSAGYWVITSTNGEEGFAKLQQSTPDLLIINPEVDGYQVIHELENQPNYRSIGVILLADRNFDETKLGISGYRVDDILVKPFTPKTLLNRVNSLIVQSRLIRQLNPLTILPGKVHLQQKIRNIVKNGEQFELIFIDLKDFTAYNKFYGFEQGNQVIIFLANLILEITSRFREQLPELYHLGGDDFCLMVRVGAAEMIGKQILEGFDVGIGRYYLEEDRNRGGLAVPNRRGLVEQWPIMTIALGIVSNQHRLIQDWLEAELIGSELLAYAKSMPGSRYVRDRRCS